MTAFSHAVKRCFNTLRKEGGRAWATKKKNQPKTATLPTSGRLPKKREQAAGHKHCNSKSEPSKKSLSPLFTQEMKA